MGSSEHEVCTVMPVIVKSRWPFADEYAWQALVSDGTNAQHMIAQSPPFKAKGDDLYKWDHIFAQIETISNR